MGYTEGAIGAEGFDPKDKVLLINLNFDEAALEVSVGVGRGGVSDTDGRAIGTFLILLSVFSPEGVSGATTGGAGLGNGAFFSFILVVVVDSFSDGGCATGTSSGVIDEAVTTGGSETVCPRSEVTVDDRGISGRTGAPWPRARSAETKAEAGGVGGTADFTGWIEISSPVVGSMMASLLLTGLAAGAD
jgi:hypothetical protein